MLPVLFRRKLRLILTVDGITDIITEGITTDITITTITIGTGPGLSASMGVQGITAIGNRSSKDHFSGPLNIRNDTKIGCILSCFFECFVGKPSTHSALSVLSASRAVGTARQKEKPRRVAASEHG